MICPVMSSPVYSKFHDHATVLVDCKGVACRWWVNDNCIVFEVIQSINVLLGRATEEPRPETPRPKVEEENPPDDLSISQSIEPAE